MKLSAENIETINQIIAECTQYADWQDSAYVMSQSELKEVFQGFAAKLGHIVASDESGGEA